MFKHQNTFTRFLHHMCTGQSPLPLKVIGGIVGITQNEKALDKFFILAPELSKALNALAAEYLRQ